MPHSRKVPGWIPWGLCMFSLYQNLTAGKNLSGLTYRWSDEDWLALLHDPWEMLGHRSSPRSWCLWRRKAEQRKDLGEFGNWVRAAPELQLIWEVPGLQRDWRQGRRQIKLIYRWSEAWKYWLWYQNTQDSSRAAGKLQRGAGEHQSKGRPWPRFSFTSHRWLCVCVCECMCGRRI